MTSASSLHGSTPLAEAPCYAYPVFRSFVWMQTVFGTHSVFGIRKQRNLERTAAIRSHRYGDMAESQSRRPHALRLPVSLVYSQFERTSLYVSPHSMTLGAEARNPEITRGFLLSIDSTVAFAQGAGGM